MGHSSRASSGTRSAPSRCTTGISSRHGRPSSDRATSRSGQHEPGRGDRASPRPGRGGKRPRSDPPHRPYPQPFDPRDGSPRGRLLPRASPVDLRGNAQAPQRRGAGQLDHRNRPADTRRRARRRAVSPRSSHFTLPQPTSPTHRATRRSCATTPHVACFSRPPTRSRRRSCNPPQEISALLEGAQRRFMAVRAEHVRGGSRRSVKRSATPSISCRPAQRIRDGCRDLDRCSQTRRPPRGLEKRSSLRYRRTAGDRQEHVGVAMRDVRCDKGASSYPVRAARDERPGDRRPLPGDG